MKLKITKELLKGAIEAWLIIAALVPSHENLIEPLSIVFLTNELNALLTPLIIPTETAATDPVSGLALSKICPLLFAHAIASASAT